MSARGLEVIDHSIQTTYEWINELGGRLGWSSDRSTLRLLRTTLRHLRDHLLVDELAQFSAQLPLLIRGMLFEGWVPKATPIKERSAEDFVRHIEAQFGDTEEYRGVADITCVFKLLNAKISAGEVEDIRASLPSDIRALWPAP
ncbi:DUF2267 domain-containing protein [Roseobacter sinensis]|uniref:DUF2267 domain-containing protein n=1 Tax=Roseobacter sinensis TaxID=2931391 RepID=A0ABT3BD41_9RHOB|nr:DUF2267 domain-containing protein [Roseobacter sp. WL0113]MCV3271492.1 DUF2267 domain-containing protein [Roseobacter sp. WL0113]